jgi:ABC-type glycerol-3-phosphate transport system permease component
MAGFAFAKFDFPFKKVLFLIVLISFMIPFELITFNLYSMMIKLQWVDSYKALIIPCIANGMIIFLFRQYYLGFPDYMLEAARIDGYGWFRMFFKIALPNSKAICVSAGLVLFMSQWESFLWPVLITRTKEMNTVQIALNSFRTQYVKNWNEIFAGSIIAFLIPIIIIIPLQKFYTEGITSAGTKE